MELLFHLSGENLDLAREEALALTSPKKFQQLRNVLILNSTYSSLLKRLAFTHGIFRVLFASSSSNFQKRMESFDFQKHYKKDFRVKVLNLTKDKTKISEKDIGNIIYKKLNNPKVNLSNPTTQFFIICTDKKIYCCELIKKIDKSFYERKPHLKPELHPTSLSPKLAKALINLTGIRKGTVLDPFCGSGGILVEAGLSHCKPVGFDIDNIMLKRARINLDHYNITDYTLALQDATKTKKKFNYIITELPFGKNSKVSIKDLSLL